MPIGFLPTRGQLRGFASAGSLQILSHIPTLHIFNFFFQWFCFNWISLDKLSTTVSSRSSQRMYMTNLLESWVPSDISLLGCITEFLSRELTEGRRRAINLFICSSWDAGRVWPRRYFTVLWRLQHRCIQLSCSLTYFIILVKPVQPGTRKIFPILVCPEGGRRSL